MQYLDKQANRHTGYWWDKEKMKMIARCSCNNDYQDHKHGDKMRVMNKTGKVLNEVPVYRCTVCEKERAVKEGSRG